MMRYQSGFTSAGPRLRLVITSAGAYSAAPIRAPRPAPTPSIASPSTAPDAAPRAAPQITASSSWPERLRRRRSGSAMPRSIAPLVRPALISYDRSMEARDLAVGLAGGRIAIGVVSLLAPGLVGRAMMGPDGDSGGTRLFLRVVGARDLALGIGVLAALDRDAPVHGWLRASAVADGLDAAGMPARPPPASPDRVSSGRRRGDRRSAAQRLAGRAARRITADGPRRAHHRRSAQHPGRRCRAGSPEAERRTSSLGRPRSGSAGASARNRVPERRPPAARSVSRRHPTRGPRGVHRAGVGPERGRLARALSGLGSLARRVGRRARVCRRRPATSSTTW